MAPLWPLTFSSVERPRALLALLLNMSDCIGKKKYIWCIVERQMLHKYVNFLSIAICQVWHVHCFVITHIQKQIVYKYIIELDIKSWEKVPNYRDQIKTIEF